MSEMRSAASAFVEKALGRLKNAWRDVAGSSAIGALPVRPLRPDLPAEDAQRVREQMRACLEATGGEVSARVRAAELGRSYLSLNAIGRGRFLRLLAEDFDTDSQAVDTAIGRVQAARDPEARRKAEQGLRRALDAPRLRLLTQFNALSEGVKFLVDMRAELLQLQRVERDSTLAALDVDLRGLLASWFDIGFLELRRITWSSPAALLEKLAAYEAVHAIQSWQDLKHRLDSDRRCFAFFHPRMPDEPLIFVEVALVNGLAGDVRVLLDETLPSADARRADTAIFYSISNAQAGLAGISFGNFLIKRVVDQLRVEFPQLRIFSTLSPIPGFRRWLDGAGEGALAIFGAADWAALHALPARVDDVQGLRALLATPDWQDDSRIAGALKGPLTRLCAQYLLEARSPRGGALDRVAHFHLSNGARVERINWMGDRSPKGIKDSAAMMVNYLYDLADIETNHEAYTTHGQIAASPAVLALLRSERVGT
ncbi:MAG: malonyl-CoA decarboxylase [Alphaproteobacteria bacterium]